MERELNDWEARANGDGLTADPGLVASALDEMRAGLIGESLRERREFLWLFVERVQAGGRRGECQLWYKHPMAALRAVAPGLPASRALPLPAGHLGVS